MLNYPSYLSIICRIDETAFADACVFVEADLTIFSVVLNVYNDYIIAYETVLALLALKCACQLTVIVFCLICCFCAVSLFIVIDNEVWRRASGKVRRG